MHRPAATAAGGGARTAGASAALADPATTHARHSAMRKEADECRRAAVKAVTKSLTNWTCNWFTAAPLFEKAAQLYGGIGEQEAALMAYMQAGECQDHNEAWPLAARDYKCVL
jgi:hypothetical protein